MAYEQLANDILKNVGGPENVAGLTHCATRLRFNLKDNKIADKEAISDLDVIQVVEANNQFQVIVGTHVATVYDEVTKLLGNQATATDIKNDTAVGKEKLNILDIISGSVTPLIPAMVGSGMVKAIVSILVSLQLLSAESPIYATLAAASNAVFYFLPFLVAFTFAQKVKANPFMAVVIVAALFEPNFTGLIGKEGLGNILGLPFVALDYSSQILPAFLAVGVMALLENRLKKIIPTSVQMIFIPTITLLIMVPLTVMVLGPIMITLSGLLSQAITGLLDFSTILTGLVLGATWIFLVRFGMHWAVLLLMINNLTQNGSDPFLGMLMPTVWAAGGVALGVALRTKDKKLKSIAFNSLIPCFVSGVSEPILYGIIVPFRKVAITYMICAGVLSAFSGVLGIKATQLAGGVFTIPTFIPAMSYLLIIALSIIIPAIAILIFGYEFKDNKAK